MAARLAAQRASRRAVITDLVSNENNIAVFRAEVVLPSGGRASGYGSESKADFADYIEKAETKAIGRALAALGYGTQFALDFDVTTDEVGDDIDRARCVRPRPSRCARPESTKVRVVAPPEIDFDEPLETIEPPTNLRPDPRRDPDSGAMIRSTRPTIAGLSSGSGREGWATPVVRRSGELLGRGAWTK